MSSSYRSNYGAQSRELPERRRRARAEDAATEAFIRKYMELAKVATKEPPPGERGDVPVHAKRKWREKKRALGERAREDIG